MASLLGIHGDLYPFRILLTTSMKQLTFSEGGSGCYFSVSVSARRPSPLLWLSWWPKTPLPRVARGLPVGFVWGGGGDESGCPAFCGRKRCQSYNYEAKPGKTLESKSLNRYPTKIESSGCAGSQSSEASDLPWPQVRIQTHGLVFERSI